MATRDARNARASSHGRLAFKYAKTLVEGLARAARNGHACAVAALSHARNTTHARWQTEPHGEDAPGVQRQARSVRYLACTAHVPRRDETPLRRGREQDRSARH